MKYLSFASALLLTSSVVFASASASSGYISSQTFLDPAATANLVGMAVTDPVDPAPNPIPACDCSNNAPPTVYPQKIYSAGADQWCQQQAPSTPRRLGVAKTTRYNCRNGVYFHCVYGEGAGCTNATDAKPTCPSNTCGPAL